LLTIRLGMAPVAILEGAALFVLNRKTDNDEYKVTKAGQTRTGLFL
jgi:hypothetical protein